MHLALGNGAIQVHHAGDGDAELCRERSQLAIELGLGFGAQALRLSQGQLGLHPLLEDTGHADDLAHRLHRHGGQQRLNRRPQRPDTYRGRRRCRTCRGHAAGGGRRGGRQGDKLAIEAAQVGNPARDFQAKPGLGHHLQGIAPLIDGLDKGLEGFTE
ncbi:hypothetical protein D3C85_935910 [compost metagenome]